MNKCTLLIDGNWLLRSRGSKFNEIFSMDKPKFERDLGKRMTIDMMAKSISVALNRFDGVVDNLILVADSRSWRKEFPKPKKLEAEYKGTRRKKENIDWYTVFDALREFCDILEGQGITVSQTWGAEGDDAIWRWSERLNAEGINCIVWTSDNDLRQLARKRGNNWTVWFNDQAALVADQRLNEQDELEFFMSDASTAQSNLMLDTVINKAEAAVRYENPDLIVMQKIVCGDKSDNIKSIVRVTKGTKEYRVTESKWEAIREKLGITTMDEFLESRDRVIDEVMNLSCVAGTTMTVKDAEDQFDYNLRLVWLDKTQVPQDVVSRIDEVQYREYSADYIKNNYKVLSGENTAPVEALFDGVQF